MKTFDETVSDAKGAAMASRGMLDQQVRQIGMTQPQYSSVSNPQAYLISALEDYIRKEARVQVLEILQGEDFYVAMARSAAAVGE